jgi:DNA modification methylase
METQNNMAIVYVPIATLIPAPYNPRTWSKEAMEQLKESLRRFGFVDPLVANKAVGRENFVLGGHMRIEAAKQLEIENVPVVFVDIPDEAKERELNLRLNKNQGEFDLALLAEFDEAFLSEVGFSSEELDNIFEEDPKEEIFDLQKELERIGIDNVTVQKGDVYDLDGSRLMCGDSTIESDMLKLMGDEKVDMVMTDPPYDLDYLHGKHRHGEATTGFGVKRNRRYLETEFLPDNFTELWMSNVALVQAKDFAIIVYESWKNIRTIWDEMAKRWKVRNMLVWHLPNRNQGYAGKHKLFSKYDIAMVGTSIPQEELNLDDEDALVQNEYETALFAISGKPQWESYGKGNRYCPSDFIEFNAGDEKSSGQAIIFGTKPVEILIPYIKILTRRNQLVLEPFGGSGSTLIASNMIGRRCFIMEKSPVYAEVILNRWTKYSGKTPQKIYAANSNGEIGSDSGTQK